MTGKLMFITPLFAIFILSSAGTAWSSFDIQSMKTIHLVIKGYDGLTETTLFQRELTAGVRQNIPTPYRGLALLRFQQGQSYPVIINKQSFLIRISAHDTLTSFTGSDENEYFYALLRGDATGNDQYEFPDLMIQSKQLLESTHAIHSINELTAKKKKFHDFVRDHYETLKSSDMVRQLIAQYFMMHEYVDYNTEGAPATDIQVEYQKSVLNGVGKWIEILKPKIPTNEVLNYCASLYYNRSMVTMASIIVDAFIEYAYCSGEKIDKLDIPEDLIVRDPSGKMVNKISDIKGQKIIAVVSTDCPVSMIETITMARRLVAHNNDKKLIIAPLQKLSEKHLAMNKMISGGNLLFIDDENWRKENLATRIKLPSFIETNIALINPQTIH